MLTVVSLPGIDKVSINFILSKPKILISNYVYFHFKLEMKLEILEINQSFGDNE